MLVKLNPCGRVGPNYLQHLPPESVYFLKGSWAIIRVSWRVGASFTQLLQLVPTIGLGHFFHISTTGNASTNLSWLAKSSVVSSSSQLSSHRCVLSPWVCVSSSPQSALAVSSDSLAAPTPFLDTYPQQGSPRTHRLLQAEAQASRMRQLVARSVHRCLQPSMWKLLLVRRRT